MSATSAVRQSLVIARRRFGVGVFPSGVSERSPDGALDQLLKG